MGNTSETFESFLGVQQGESLSPFLFCMFVNDLKYCLESKGVEGITVGDLTLSPRMAPKGNHLADRGCHFLATSVITVFNLKKINSAFRQFMTL